MPAPMSPPPMTTTSLMAARAAEDDEKERTAGVERNDISKLGQVYRLAGSKHAATMRNSNSNFPPC